MHAVIPVLFVVAVEAARHAVGRLADLTADKHMEGVRLARWLLAFPSTFRLWRRMKLWELRSYDEVIKLERDRLVYRTRLRARYGRAWRRRAPVEALLPLRLARYGVPLSQTDAAGLAAAGIEAAPVVAAGRPAPDRPPVPEEAAAEHPADNARLTVPVAPGRKRPLGGTAGPLPIPEPRTAPAPAAPEPAPAGLPDDVPRDEAYYAAFRAYVAEKNDFPDARQFGRYLLEAYGVTGREGGPLGESYLRTFVRDFRQRFREDMETAEHIP